MGLGVRTLGLVGRRSVATMPTADPGQGQGREALGLEAPQLRGDARLPRSARPENLLDAALHGRDGLQPLGALVPDEPRRALQGEQKLQLAPQLVPVLRQDVAGGGRELGQAGRGVALVQQLDPCVGIAQTGRCERPDELAPQGPPGAKPTRILERELPRMGTSHDCCH